MRRALNIFSTPTAKSSTVFYVGSFINNIGRYLFHLVLLRLLLPSEYGEFLSYLSLLYLLGIPTGTIANVVTKYVSEFKGENDTFSINAFFYYLLKKISPITTVLSLLLIIFSSQLATIFKANSMAFVVLGLSTFISLAQTIAGSYLLALQHFVFQTVINFFSIILTVVISALLIKGGWGATGAISGQLIAGIITSLIFIVKIKKNIFPPKFEKLKRKVNLKQFSGFALIFSIGTLSIISTDILVVRLLFDSFSSGVYSSMSILGRMILFGLTPIISLTIPIATNRHASSKSTKSVFFKLGGAVLLLGTIGATIFSLFPSLIVRYLSGTSYLEYAHFLPYVAIAMVFFAVNQFILSFFMAIGRPKANIYLLLITILQPLLYLLHKGSLSYIFQVNLLLQISLAIILSVDIYRYFWNQNRR